FLPRPMTRPDDPCRDLSTSGPSCRECTLTFRSLDTPPVRFFRDGIEIEELLPMATRTTTAPLAGALVVLSMAVPQVRADEPKGADPAPAAVSYDKQIRPIFQARCQGCHQPAKPGGGYVMTAFDRLLTGGKSKTAAIVPSKPEESYL